MDLRAIFSRSSQTHDIDGILRHQLQWMLLLRVILYTLLLGVSVFLGSPEFEIIVLPRPLFILLILVGYAFNHKQQVQAFVARRRKRG